MKLPCLFTVIRNIFFGTLFIAVGLYLCFGGLFGRPIEFPGGMLNYIFGIIAILYGGMRLVLYRKGCEE